MKRIALAAALAALCPGPHLAAQEPPSPAATEAQAVTPAEAQAATPDGAQAPVRGPVDAAELEAWSDGAMHALLAEFDVAGSVVTVVSGGEVLFAKGYGYADWEARAPVDPATTLFRIGSVSKLFTWISVMQMAEEGLVDLDADVNDYLEIHVPDAFDRPVTLSDIMAHAGGFEDHVIELIVSDTSRLRPLDDILRDQMPERVRPPGDISSYSNHATGIAAHVVERVSGSDWLTYVEQRILDPLGMERTTFRQPLPEHLREGMSKGYTFSDGRFVEGDFEIVPLAPVGSAASSGLDMARFMIANLGLGALGDARILEEETARRMQSDHHRMAPGVNGMAHGFMVMDANGERIIGHGGDTRLFHTTLALFPEHDLGVFASFNSARGGAARGAFLSSFVDHYFPVGTGPVPEPPEDFAERAGRFVGEYRANRFSHSTIVKWNALEGTDVALAGDGTLRALGARWVETGPLTFQEVAGARRMIFRESDDGDVTHFFLSGTPIVAWERVPLLERAAIHVPLRAFAFFVMGVTLLAPVVGAVQRRWYRVPPDVVAQTARLPLGARATLWIACALMAAGLALIETSGLDGIGSAFPASLPVALAFPVAAVVPTAASLPYAVLVWRRGRGRVLSRAFYTVAALTMCAFVWHLSVWNVLGWQY